jgi:gliding motility-associated-like protein
MKSLRRISCILLVLLLKVSTSVGQIDTAFWFAAPWVTPSHNGNTPVVLRIATFGNPTSVRVYQPAGTYDTTINIAANSLYSHDLSWIINTLENKPANSVLPYGLRISSDFPITVVYEVVSNSNLNPETYSLKGQNGLGTEFVCPFQTKWNIGPFNPVLPYSQINIVATQNGTTVWITPRCAVVGHAANTTYSITLNAGESYTLENITELESVNGNNMSGTIIVSDKPVAVTVSDDSVWNQAGGGCRDLMGDQIVPTDVIGTEYIVNIGQMNAASQEGIFVVATKNFTTVTVNDGTVTTYTLNQGDTWYYQIQQPLTYVTSDKNIYVIQASGFGCELGEAILPPINCSGSQQVSFTRTNAQAFILNILCKAGTEGAFTLNGSTTLVTAANFTVVPGTGGAWMGAQIQFNTTDIPVGTANLLTNSMDNFSLGVINGGATSGCLFHYMSSFIRRVYTDAGPDMLQCTNNISVNLNGSVTGGTTSGVWTTPNGTGTFTSPTSVSTGYTLSGLDSTKSTLTFVLTSTGNCLPVSDTVVLYLAKSPIVTAGADVTQCANNITPISLNGYFNYALGATWAGGNGGAFSNSASTSTTYTPSPADISAGQVLITYSSTGSIFGCPNTVDSLYLNFTPAPLVNAGPDVVICANTPKVLLNGSVTGGSTSGVWSTTGTGNFSPSSTNLSAFYNLSLADQAQTSLTIHLTSTNNGLCNSEQDSLTITITPAPVVNAGVDDTICSNMGSIALSGTVAGGASSGSWSTIGGTGSFTNANALSTAYNMSSPDTSAGTVTILLTSTGGTCPPVTDTVVYIIEKAPAVAAGADMNVCDNAAITLNGVITGFTSTGNWTTTGTGTFVPSSSSLNSFYYPSAADVTAGSIQFILTSTNNKGCNPSIDTMQVTFVPSPAANFTFVNNCFGANSLFTDASSTTVGTINAWNWDFGDNTTAISQNAVHPYTLPGTYTVTHVVTGSNGCRDTVRKPITVYALPNANFSFNTPCQNNVTVFLDSSVAFPATVVNWSWSFGDGSGDTVNQNPTHIYATPGTYTATLVVESSLGCFDTLKKAVTVLPSPVANFTMSPNPANALDVVSFTDLSTPQSTLITWYWDFGDTLLSNLQNPTHTYLNAGNYSVLLEVTDQYGCKDTIRRDILISLLPQVPTAFTPNGDGANDFLFVRGGPFEKMHFRVYNNWGELVFETTDQKIGWDGTVSGVEQPMSVYVWMLDVETYNKKIIHKSGDVTLLK